MSLRPDLGMIPVNYFYAHAVVSHVHSCLPLVKHQDTIYRKSDNGHGVHRANAVFLSVVTLA